MKNTIKWRIISEKRYEGHSEEFDIDIYPSINHKSYGGYDVAISRTNSEFAISKQRLVSIADAKAWANAIVSGQVTE